MASHEDRRRVTVRLSVLQYVDHRRVLDPRGQLLGAAGRRSTRSSRRWPRTTTSGRWRCGRRAAIVFDRDGQVLVENRHSFSISIVREHTKDLNRTVRLLAAVLGIDEARRPRDRRSPSPRAVVPADRHRRRTRRWRRSRRSRRAGSTSSCRTSSSSRCRRGAIPTTLAAHLFGYVGEVSDAQVAGDDALKSGDIVGQSGIEKIYNALLMGEDGAQARRRQQRRPRNPDARGGASRSKASACS